MVFRARFFSMILLLPSLFILALADTTTSNTCNDLLGSVLDAAKVDVWRSVRSSKNYKPLSDFLLSEESPVAPTQESEHIPGVGVLRLSTDLRTGASVLHRADPATGASEVLFDTQSLPKANAWGRLESVSVSPDRKTLVVGYRNYGDGVPPFEEIRRPLSSLPGETSSAAIPPGPVIRNYTTIGAALRSDEGEYELRNYGLNASTDLVLTGNDGTQKLIDSSFAQDRNGRTKILNVLVSPNYKYLVIQSFRDGSIDHYQFKIYNREAGRMEQVLDSGAKEVNWLDGSTISYRTYSEADHGQIVSLDLDPAAKPLVLNPVSFESNINIPDLGSPVGKIGDNLFYFAKSDSGDPGSLKMIEGDKIDPQSASSFGGPLQGKTIYPALEEKLGAGKLNDALVIDGSFQRGDYLFLQLKAGGQRIRKIFDSKGQDLGNLVIPNCCALTYVDWIDPGKTLKLKFASVVPGQVDVTYDLAKKVFDPPNFERKLMTQNGVAYTSEIVNVTSRDGTVVPMRVSHRKDLILDGSHPTYMEVYGGFDESNPGFSPYFSPMKLRFMKQGGVWASPALRGGNEFGEKWHIAGADLNKVKTYEDTAAAAQYLIDHRISGAKKIILTGASNGGLVSAEVGLTYPDLFGLVIPENGPYDLANTEILDARSQGANYEYGSNSVPAEKQNKIDNSPLEKAKNPPPDAPEFFIVNGAEDSRVNPEHSTRFYETLKRNSARPETVQMLRSPFSGHGNYSNYDGVIGWSTESAIWTKIYDYLGWQFK